MSRYEGSYSGLGAMIRSECMRAEMESRARKVAEFAEATAPVYEGPDDPHRGRFKGDFRVSSTGRGGWKSDRAAGIVENVDPAAVEIEFGTSRTAAHHTLLKALHAAAGG